MGLRKRSAKLGSDKWLSVAFHNVRVDMHRNRKASDERKKRLSAISSKLRGEGIDETWAETTLSLMESNGYGLNQFSTRVIPALRDEMQRTALREGQIEADRQASAARSEQKRLDRERRAIVRREANDMAKLGAVRRKAILKSAKAAIPLTDRVSGPVDPISMAESARAAVLSSIDADLSRVEQVLASTGSTKHDLVGAIGSSPYFRKPRPGVMACVALVLLEVAVVFVLASLLSPVFFEAETAKSVLGGVMLCAPLWGAWRVAKRRSPRMRLSMDTVKAAVKVAFWNEFPVSGIAPPAFSSTDIPIDMRTRLEAVDRKVEAFPRRLPA